MSTDDTPTTEKVEARYAYVGNIQGGANPSELKAFDRWLAGVEAAAEKRGAERERERIVTAVEDMESFALDLRYLLGYGTAKRAVVRLIEAGE